MVLSHTADDYLDFVIQKFVKMRGKIGQTSRDIAYAFHLINIDDRIFHPEVFVKFSERVCRVDPD